MAPSKQNVEYLQHIQFCFLKDCLVQTVGIRRLRFGGLHFTMALATNSLQHYYNLEKIVSERMINGSAKNIAAFCI